MKRRIKIIFGIILSCFLLIIGNEVYAASASVSAGKTNLELNETTTINVSIASVEAWNLKISANGGTLTGTQSVADAAGEEVSKSVMSAEFKADTAGTYTVSLTGNITGSNLVKENVSKSVTITVKAPEPAPEPEPTPEPVPNPEPTPTPVKSSDASLKKLSISPIGNNINKSSAGIYDITVDNKYEKITISATPNNSKARVISGNGEFSLEDGTNNFKVVVKAEDGTESVHKIRIIRKAAEKTETLSPPNIIDEVNNEKAQEEEVVEEADFGISNLVITGIELNPKFSLDVYEYVAEFSEDTDTLEIIATPTSDDASVEIIGNTNLKIGENLITIMVKSPDGKTTKTYQITVTKNETDTVLATVEPQNDSVTNTTQELKKKIGKIVLIATAAIIAVILIGIIAITNIKKNKENYGDKKINKDSSNKNDFKLSVDEDESYKELEKLANIHSNKGIFEDKEDEKIFDEEIAEEFSEIKNYDSKLEKNNAIIEEKLMDVNKPSIFEKNDKIEEEDKEYELIEENEKFEEFEEKIKSKSKKDFIFEDDESSNMKRGKGRRFK